MEGVDGAAKQLNPHTGCRIVEGGCPEKQRTFCSKCPPKAALHRYIIVWIRIRIKISGNSLRIKIRTMTEQGRQVKTGVLTPTLLPCVN